MHIRAQPLRKVSKTMHKRETQTNPNVSRKESKVVVQLKTLAAKAIVLTRAEELRFVKTVTLRQTTSRETKTLQNTHKCF